MMPRARQSALMVLAACGPQLPTPTGMTADASSGTSSSSSTGGDAPAACGAVAPTCGPAPCVVATQVDLTDPARRTYQRPELLVDADCRPHALLLGTLDEPRSFSAFYLTTDDGQQWTSERVPLDANSGAMFLDPVDETPVVVGQLMGDFTSSERRDGVWRAVGFTGPGLVEGAARTPDGITHVLAKTGSEHVLRRFAGDVETGALVIGRTNSVATTRMEIDRGGAVLQTAYFDQPEFDTRLGTRWWCDGHADELTNLDYVHALAAAGDVERPRAFMLGSVDGDLWLSRRDDDGAWSRWFVAARPVWGEAYPEEAVDGQVFVRHVREVHAIAVAVDLAGAPRWVWSEIERDEPWVAGGVGWSLHSADVTGSSALWIGWLDEHGEPAARLLDDSLAARAGDAVVDDAGVLHLIVMAGPIHSKTFDLWPTYLRLEG